MSPLIILESHKTSKIFTRSNILILFRYKFNIKGFPKGDKKFENTIPDNIADLNTPNLEADHRVIKQMNPMAGTSAGLTPMLQSRPVDRAKVVEMFGVKSPALNPIKEEEITANKTPTQVKRTLNALKGL